MSNDLLIALRAWLASLLVCAVFYPLATLGFARLAAPERAAGSLLRDAAGRIVGSRLVAQAFERPEYLWPRPSAVAYDAAATGGSNLAPSNPALRARAAATVARYAAAPANPLPAELVAASGSGIDPHISLAGALFQVPRIAAARGVAVTRVEEIVRRAAVNPPWSPPLVNVLETNLALDEGIGSALRR